VVSAPRIHVDVTVEQTLETRIEETIITVEESTPYSPLRELYEVPVGVVSLPFAILGEVADVLVFGLLPNEAVDGYASWTFASLNPALNAESDTRLERTEIARQVRERDSQRTVVRLPAADQAVVLRFPDEPEIVVMTDRGGHAIAHVLDVARTGIVEPPRKLELRVSETPLEHTFYLDRRLTLRIYQAEQWLQVLERPDASATELADAVAAIDELGFTRFSLEAEDTIHTRHERNPQFLSLFRRTLAEAYGQSIPESGTKLFPVAADQ
jgi:hypothetical protein